jgi:GST-like protein
MSYTVFGDLRSGAFSAEAALAEAGAPYDFHLVSLDRNEQKAPGFLAMNPSGKLPALKTPEGDIVTESAAILLTIADHFPNAGLLPAPGTPARASAYRWLAFMASEIYPMVEITDYPDRSAADGSDAEALREKARDRIRERILVVERNIDGPWVLPGGFSICDIYAAMFSQWSIGKEWRQANLPKLLTLTAELATRPRTGAVWARHFNGD